MAVPQRHDLRALPRIQSNRSGLDRRYRLCRLRVVVQTRGDRGAKGEQRARCDCKLLLLVQNSRNVLERLSGSRHGLDQRRLLCESKTRKAGDQRPLEMTQALGRRAVRQKNTRNHRDRDQFGTHDNFLPAKK